MLTLVTAEGRLVQKIDVNLILDRIGVEYTSESSGCWETVQLEIDEAKKLVDRITHAITSAQVYKDTAAQKAYAAKVALYEELKRELGR